MSFLAKTKIQTSLETFVFIDSLKAGDTISCKLSMGLGNVRVIDVIREEVASLIKLELSNKNMIYCTPDQIFFEDSVANNIQRNSIMPTLLTDATPTPYVVRSNTPIVTDGQKASKNNNMWAAVVGATDKKAEVFRLVLEVPSRFYIANGVYAK
jgi:hypothetical protein